MLTRRPFWPPGENGDNALRDTPTEAIAPLWHGATPGEKPHGKLTNHDSLLIRRAAPADGKFAIVCYTSGRTYAHFKPDSDTAESKDMSRRGLLAWGFANPGNQNGALNAPAPAAARQKLGRYKTTSRCRAVVARQAHNLNVAGSNPATATSPHRRSSPGAGAQHTQLTCAGLRKSEKSACRRTEIAHAAQRE